MKILSIDTSSNICAVAVLEDTQLLKEYSQNNGLTHSENLMPIIQNVLSSLNLSLKDIDLIVCDKGPGSFTGIRIGIATSMAFVDSLGLPCVGISSLEALSYNVQENGIICTLIDAKKENAYCGLFEKTNDKYLQKRDFSADNIENILNELSKLHTPITFVGDGAIAYKDIIEQSITDGKFVENNDLSAYNLGLAGLYHFKNNSLDDLLPLYLRKPQAERVLEAKLKNGN